MNSRSATTRRRPARPFVGQLAALGALLGFAATLLVATAASAAPSPTPHTTTVVKSITVTGPANKKPLTFRADQQPDQYNALLNEVSWMDGHNPDIFAATPTDLGAHYVVTIFQGSKVVARYDLYPDVKGGPRAHRQEVGSTKAAWFFAPIDMSSTLAAVGVKLPSAVATDGILSHSPKSTPLMKSISGIFRQSVTALALAGLGCLAILVLLGAAARRSRAVDHRRTVPPAITRLNTAKARAAAGPGAAIRPAIPSGRRPTQLGGRPFAVRLATLTRRTAPDSAPVSPPGAAPASAPVAVTRPRTAAGTGPIGGTAAKAPATSWRNWRPLKSLLPTGAKATTAAAQPDLVPAGVSAHATATADTPAKADALESPTTSGTPTVSVGPDQPDASAAPVPIPTKPPTIPAQATSTRPDSTTPTLPNQRLGGVATTSDAPAASAAATPAGTMPAVTMPDKPGGPGSRLEPASRTTPPAQPKAPSLFEPTRRVVEPPEPVDGPTEVVKTPTTQPIDGPTEVVKTPTTQPIDGPTEVVKTPTTQPIDGPTEVVKTPTTQPIDGPTEVVKTPTTQPIDGPTEVVKTPTAPIDGPTEVIPPPVDAKAPDQRRGDTPQRGANSGARSEKADG